MHLFGVNFEQISTFKRDSSILIFEVLEVSNYAGIKGVLNHALFKSNYFLNKWFKLVL